MKRNLTETTPTPDKTGSRAASTAQFSKLLIAWRKRHGISQADAAATLKCSERCIRDWEARRRMPRGFNLWAVMIFIAPRVPVGQSGVSMAVVETVRGGAL